MMVEPVGKSSGYRLNPKSRYKKSPEMSYRKFLEELRKLKSKGKDKVVSNTLDSLIRKHTGGRKAYHFKYFVKRAERSGFLVFVRTGVWEITDRVILYGNDVNKFRSYS